MALILTPTQHSPAMSSGTQAKFAGIDQISTKLQGAKELGIRRVFIPLENFEEVKSFTGIKVIPVESVAETYGWLHAQTYQDASAEPKRLAQIKIRELEISLETQGIRTVSQKEEEEYKRITITLSNFRDEVPLLVYYGQKGLRHVVGVKDTALKRMVQEGCAHVFGVTSEVKVAEAGKSKRLYNTYEVSDPTLQQIIHKHVFARGDAMREEEKNCNYRAKIVKANQTVFVRQFVSGRLTVDGFNPLFDEVDGNIRAILGVPDPSLNNEGGNQTRLQEQIPSGTID